MSQHLAVYVRVSSSSQKDSSQLADLKAFLERQPEQEVRWYHDSFTGKTMDRPGMNSLLAELEKQRVSTILVWRLDRLGRTAAGLTRLFEELAARKVNLVSLKDNLDLSTPAGRLMAHVLASVAAYETEVRRERQIAGIQAAKAAGKTWGGSEKGRLLKVNPEQVAIIKTLKGEGKGVSHISRTTGLSRPTIYRVLANHV